MRVLLVNDYAPGEGWGAETHLARLIDGLEAAGDAVECLHAQDPRTGLGKALNVWDPRARRALARRASRFRPDVVHHHNVLRELSVSVLGVPGGVPTILTVHDLRLFGVPDAPSGLLWRAAVAVKARLDVTVARARTDVAIGVSGEIAERLRRAGFSRVERVPNFAPVPSASDATPMAESTDVVFAGRLTPDKGAAVLAEAFVRIADRHPSARLIVAGDGPERGRVSAIAARAAPGRVVLPGRVSSEAVRAFMGRARVVVAPSIPRLRPEGAGLTVIEAALLGRPSIVSDDAPLRELVDDAGCGIVVPPEDPAALAVALDQLLGDPKRAQALGDAGRRATTTTHTPEAVVSRIRGLYADAIRTTASPRGGPRGAGGGGR